MGMLSKGMERIREFKLRRRAQSVANLFRETADFERKFTSEAKRLGININGLGQKSHYETLGLRHTGDQREIKEAYVSMAKRYHPDVSTGSEATHKMAEINEAYAVLRDKKKKEAYDAGLSRGGGEIGEEAVRAISNAFLRQYSELRNRDFEEFNKRVAVPQHKDSIKAAIEEAADWSKRFARAESRVLGNLRDYGRGIRRLSSVNRDLLKGEKASLQKERLEENLIRLRELEKSYLEIERGVSAVIARIRDEISANENNVADRLRRSIS